MTKWGLDDIAKVALRRLSDDHFRTWRDRRLREVSAATVAREMTLLSAVCRECVREWKWMTSNPLRLVTRPQNSPPRSRRPTAEEIERILYSAGYSAEQAPLTATARVGASIVWGIETAMRSSETCALTWAHVNIGARTAYLPTSKNGHARTVPLSLRAMQLLEQLRPVTGDRLTVFDIEDRVRDVVFRRLRDRMKIDGLHYHDLRREALTRLAQKFGPMDLAKISGHRDLSLLLSTYYAPDVSDLVARLD